MHATLRRLKCAPGRASEVAQLIQTEYLPQLDGVEGVISYTLVHSGQDEVASVGVFTSQAGAMRANELAQAWAKDRLAGLGAAPLEALDGEVLLHTIFSSRA
jgi:hypothetical protein